MPPLMQGTSSVSREAAAARDELRSVPLAAVQLPLEYCLLHGGRNTFRDLDSRRAIFSPWTRIARLTLG